MDLAPRANLPRVLAAVLLALAVLIAFAARAVAATTPPPTVEHAPPLLIDQRPLPRPGRPTVPELGIPVEIRHQVEAPALGVGLAALGYGAYALAAAIVFHALAAMFAPNARRAVGLLAAALALAGAGETRAAAIVGAGPEPGGQRGPNGIVAQLDLPRELRKENSVGSDRAGLCVFTSLYHAGAWQSEAAFADLLAEMRRLPGGGYPEKVDSLCRRYCPNARYVQHTGGSAAFLDAAIRARRMPCVTYCGHDPVYPGQTIAHMVNLVHLDADRAAVLDNNRPDQLMWMSRAQFLERWRGNNGGWAVVLLNPAPAPVPRN